MENFDDNRRWSNLTSVSYSAFDLDRIETVTWWEANKFALLAGVSILVFVCFGLGVFQHMRSFRHYMPEGTRRNRFQPDAPPPTVAPARIRILSWNIFMRPPLISNHGGDYKNERLKYFISDYLDKYDIVALQEMFLFGSGRRRHLIRAAKQCGFLYHTSAPHNLIDAGLLILSRFPIMQSAFRSFPRGIHSDMLASKGVLHARILVSDGIQIDLFTTHLQASYRHPSSARELKIRKIQLDIIHNFINEHCDAQGTGNGITVLCGDLNINSSSPEEDFVHLHALFNPHFVSLNNVPTFGVTTECLNSCHKMPALVPEVVFTKPHDWGTCQAIDHFWMRGMIEGYEAKCSIEQMLVRQEEKRFTHLSGNLI